jgi:hypothetical protein
MLQPISDKTKISQKPPVFAKSMYAAKTNTSNKSIQSPFSALLNLQEDFSPVSFLNHQESYMSPFHQEVASRSNFKDSK